MIAFITEHPFLRWCHALVTPIWLYSGSLVWDNPYSFIPS